MACLALCRTLRRSATSLLSSTTCFGRYHLQRDLPQANLCGGPLPLQFLSRRPFSSSSSFYNFSGVEDDWGACDAGNSTCTASQELISDFPSPVHLLMAGLDNLHNLTGLPWWGTIFMSAIILRTFMLPLKIVQDRKVAEIRSLGPKLQLEQLAWGFSQGRFLDECRLLMKRKQEHSCPSLLWMLGPGILIQVPFVLTLVYSLRKMALERHPGFDTGGMMWFSDLTVAGKGLVGALLPLTVAFVYFGNVHVLFVGPSIRKGLYEKFRKALEISLKCSTLFIFWLTYHAPQALQAFLVPHSIMTLSQTLLFGNKNFVAQVVKPKKNVAVYLPVTSGSQHQAILDSYAKLLKEAGSHFTSGNNSEAVKLLKNAIKEEPEKGEAYALLGLVYKAHKDWINSASYYKQAIHKGETDDFKIAAYAGCGLALMKQGAAMECVEIMRPIRSFDVPERPDSKHCYYASLVILGRALLEAGFKDESQEVVQLYKELHLDETES